MIDYLLRINPIVLALMGGIFSFLVTSAGSALVFFFRKVNKSLLDYMMAFAAGIMISASFFSLLSPGIDMLKEQGKSSFIISSISFLAGGLFIVISDHIINKLYKKKSKLKRDILLVSSITIHNIPEGMAIGVAFAFLFSNNSVGSLMNAIMITLGIAIQNFPEGSSISLPLRRDKVGTFKSFLLGSMSGFVEIISALIGVLFASIMINLLPAFLCFASGAMIFVTTKELIPECLKNKKKNLVNYVILFGFAVMMILDVSLG